MYLINKVMQLLNSVDAMIDNTSLLHFSLVIDADFDAVTISETIASIEA
ncbi:MAG: hypothetical protein V4570_09835 [Pseudomonadota bacterium]